MRLAAWVSLYCLVHASQFDDVGADSCAVQYYESHEHRHHHAHDGHGGHAHEQPFTTTLFVTPTVTSVHSEPLHHSLLASLSLPSKATTTTAAARPSNSSASRSFVEPSAQLVQTFNTTTASNAYTSTAAPSSLPSQENESNRKGTSTQRLILSSSASSSIVHSVTQSSIVASPTFTHPGLLQTSEDISRIRSKVAAGEQPWTLAWQKLLKSSFADPSWKASPLAVVYRGSDGVHAENYGTLYRDIGAAYALAICWSVSQNDSYGAAAVRIMDAWSSTLTELSGPVDLYLAAGIYGYEFAQAAELMREYPGWDFVRFKDMLVNVFYAKINGWFTDHQDWAEHAAGVWANWDLCNIAGAMSIGVLADNVTIYERGLDWFLTGNGNGRLTNAIPYTFWYDDQELAQLMEAGRDQGHSGLNIGLLGVLGKIGTSQGNDLFGRNDSLILAAAEYYARYNLGFDVPFKPFDNGILKSDQISNVSRGDVRPVWELLYNHYGQLKHENVTWTKRYRDHVVAQNGGAEGGSGDYGPNSGGFDQLGWGTLLYTV